MSTEGFGLDLHEWLTRWQELEEQLEIDATDALPEACDFVAQMLNAVRASRARRRSRFRNDAASA